MNVLTPQKSPGSRELWKWLPLIALGFWWPASVSPGAETDVRRDAAVAAVEKAMPSVVNIATETVRKVRDPLEELFQEFWDRYHRRQPPNSQFSIGSGVIIDEEGYVLTNDHVVRRADKIAVKLASGTNAYEAKLIASDSKTDVALLKIIAPPGEKFTAIKFGADDDLLLGETVLSLGNPFGLGGSVSRGILSSKTRVAPKGDGQLDLLNCLQTDASINPGNSGGPLINLRGELIGLNVAILREAQGIGFAVPVKQVAEALAGVFTPESVKQLWFGARVKARAPLVVTAVESGSPADKAGLKTGDTILQTNGQTPKGFMDFNEKLIAGGAADASLAILRNGERRDVKVRLVPEKSFFNAELIQRKLGISLQELTRINSTEGFIIAGVERDSPAAATLQRGFLVTAIDGQTPADLTAAAKILNAKKKGDKVELGIVTKQQRGNRISYQQGVVAVPVR